MFRRSETKQLETFFKGLLSKYKNHIDEILSLRIKTVIRGAVLIQQLWKHNLLKISTLKIELSYRSLTLDSSLLKNLNKFSHHCMTALMSSDGEIVQL